MRNILLRQQLGKRRDLELLTYESRHKTAIGANVANEGERWIVYGDMALSLISFLRGNPGSYPEDGGPDRPHFQEVVDYFED